MNINDILTTTSALVKKYRAHSETVENYSVPTEAFGRLHDKPHQNHHLLLEHYPQKWVLKVPKKDVSLMADNDEHSRLTESVSGTPSGIESPVPEGTSLQQVNHIPGMDGFVAVENDAELAINDGGKDENKIHVVQGGRTQFSRPHKGLIYDGKSRQKNLISLEASSEIQEMSVSKQGTVVGGKTGTNKKQIKGILPPQSINKLEGIPNLTKVGYGFNYNSGSNPVAFRPEQKWIVKPGPPSSKMKTSEIQRNHPIILPAKANEMTEIIPPSNLLHSGGGSTQHVSESIEKYVSVQSHKATIRLAYSLFISDRGW